MCNKFTYLLIAHFIGGTREVEGKLGTREVEVKLVIFSLLAN